MISGKAHGLAAAGILFLAVLAAADWTTFAGDSQRTGIATPAAKNLNLLWSTTLDSSPIEFTTATTPLVMGNIVIAGTNDDRLFALNAETGKLVWSRHFDTQAIPFNRGTGGWLCPDAMLATPVIDSAGLTVYALSADGRLRILDLSTGEDKHAPVPFVPPFSKNWSLNLVDGIIYTATSQNCNRAENGVWAIRINNPDWQVTHWRSAGGIWGSAGVAAGFDGAIFAELGDSDMTANLASAVVALKPGTLELADYFSPPDAESLNRRDLDMGSMSPLVFRFGQQTLVAAAGKEGRIFLLDAASPGGSDHHTPLFQTPLYTNEDEDFAGHGFWGAMSTWMSASGDSRATRWLLAPAWGPQHSASPAFPVIHGDAPDGSLMAFQLQLKDGKPALAPAWRSRNLKTPQAAVVAGNIVFALASGETSQQVDDGGSIMTSKQRLQLSSHAILYVLDAATGEELWSSGEAMKGISRFSGPAVSRGRVFVTARDGMNPPALYAFGP